MAIVLKEKNLSECVCPKCGCTIGYTNDDLYMSVDDNNTSGLGLDCPNCRAVIITKKIAQDKWPDAFFSFKDGYSCSDQEIQKYIDLCVKELRKGDSDYAYTGTGNTFIMANWDDDAIVVRVCRGYYEAYIDVT